MFLDIEIAKDNLEKSLNSLLSTVI